MRPCGQPDWPRWLCQSTRRAVTKPATAGPATPIRAPVVGMRLKKAAAAKPGGGFSWIAWPFYPYAAMAYRVREDTPLPYPWFFKRELPGREIRKLTQGGIPTGEIRRWMLTPCW